MEITKSYIPSNLAKNHDREREVWLVYFKAASGKTNNDYEGSVEEALCFGWIDSIIQKIDEEKYARKFNPRRVGSLPESYPFSPAQLHPLAFKCKKAGDFRAAAANID